MTDHPSDPSPSSPVADPVVHRTEDPSRPVADDVLTAVAAALAALCEGHHYDYQCPVCTKDFATLARVAASTTINLPMLTCGCCGLCGAPPGHQHPATGKPWQHTHAQAGEQR